MRKIIKIGTAATEQNINILHANWNIWWWFWYQTSEHYLLSEHKSNDINGYSSTKHTSHTLQTFVFKIFRWRIPIILKYLYHCICFKSCKKIITRKTGLHKALLVTFPHTLLSPPMYLNLDPTNDVFTVGDTLVGWTDFRVNCWF